MVENSQNKRDLDVIPNVIFELYVLQKSVNELCKDYGISPEQIKEWEIDILSKTNELVIEEKRKIIDSYIIWEKTKLIEIDPMHMARKCVEHIARARIIDCHKIVEFKSKKAVERYKNLNVFSDPRESTFNLNTLLDIAVHYELLPPNITAQMNKVRLKGNLSVHDHSAYKSEIEKFHNILTTIIDDFFKIYNELQWKEKYVIPQIDSMYQDLSRGLAIETKKLEDLELNYQETYLNEQIEDAKNKYFNYLEIECGKIQFEFKSADNKAGFIKETLENSFVPLSLIELTNYNSKDFYHGKRLKIIDLLSQKKRLAILGNPGYGKSTLLKSIAISFAFPHRGKQLFGNWQDKSSFPIYILCRNLGERSTSPIIDIINNISERAEIHSIRKHFEQLVLKSIGNGNAILIIDGLDEIIDDRTRILFLNQLKTFLETYPDIKAIISSRENGFLDERGLLSLDNHCTHYVIAPLLEDEMEKLTINWHKIVMDDFESAIKEAKVVFDKINYNWEIKILAENPLLLTSLLFVNKEDGYLPAKRVSLYEKTTRLLLNTWNIEGHGDEQLDYYDTELQLAYVAYWMTKNEKQVINEIDLIQCLKEARQQINQKLDYSISDFIKRVEHRSGLLRKTDIISYEFVHLSFQEYLTAIAIVKKYLPKEDSEIELLNFLFLKLTEKNWKEVLLFIIPMLPKKIYKKIIIDSIQSCKNITQKDMEIAEELQFSIRFQYLSVFEELVKINTEEKVEQIFYLYNVRALLGKLIEYEVDFDELLEDALEWFAKGHNMNFWATDWGMPNILKSKYAEAFKKKVRNCFFNKYEDEYVRGLLSSLIEISTFPEDVMKEKDLDTFFNSVKKNIKDTDKETKCMGILRLICDYSLLVPELATGEFNDGQLDLFQKKMMSELGEIFKELLHTTSFDDLHYYCVVAITIGTLGANHGYYMNYDDYIKLFFDGWVKDTPDNLQYISAFGLSGILYPDHNIECIKKLSNIQNVIKQKYESPKHKLDKLVSIYLAINLEMELDMEDVTKTMRHSGNSLSLRLFGEKIGLELDS